MTKTYGDRFLDVVEGHNKKNKIDDPFEIGTVVAESPLTIEIEGLPLYRENLYINPYLLSWDETVNITTSINENHSHTITTINHSSKLIVGVLVACYGIEYNEVGKTYQKYVVTEVVE